MAPPTTATGTATGNRTVQLHSNNLFEDGDPAALQAELQRVRLELQAQRNIVAQEKQDLEQRQQLLRQAAGAARQEVLALRAHKVSAQAELDAANAKVESLAAQLAQLAARASAQDADSLTMDTKENLPGDLPPNWAAAAMPLHERQAGAGSNGITASRAETSGSKAVARAGAHQELARLKQQLQDLQQQCAGKDSSLSLLRSQTMVGEQEHARLEALLQSRERELGAAQAEAGTAGAQIRQLRKDLIVAQTALDKANAAVEAKEAKMMALSERLSALEAAAAGLKGELLEKDRAVSGALKAKARLQQHLAAAKERDTCGQEVQTLQALMASLHSERDALDRQKTRLTAEVAALQAAKGAALAKTTEASAELQSQVQGVRILALALAAALHRQGRHSSTEGDQDADMLTRPPSRVHIEMLICEIQAVESGLQAIQLDPAASTLPGLRGLRQQLQGLWGPVGSAEVSRRTSFSFGARMQDSASSMSATGTACDSPEDGYSSPCKDGLASLLAALAEKLASPRPLTPQQGTDGSAELGVHVNGFQALPPAEVHSKTSSDARAKHTRRPRTLQKAVAGRLRSFGQLPTGSNDQPVVQLEDGTAHAQAADELPADVEPGNLLELTDLPPAVVTPGHSLHSTASSDSYRGRMLG
ncbi:hypothetical protein WJX72_006441 [[Myrmecia] bisecta]|uniref:Uncharacterized protein n=1 Tax=[Myrmecia] bisecta TaxID=41462 RepID=A0AAW1QFE2_9CHLO